MILDSLNAELSALYDRFNSDEDYRPSEVKTSFGTHGVVYAQDEDGDDYILIGFNIFQRGIFAEIDSGTYGDLQGFRFYLDPSHQRPRDEDED